MLGVVAVLTENATSLAFVLLTAHAEVDRVSWHRSDEDRLAISVINPGDER
jgi:hypothetical protein